MEEAELMKLTREEKRMKKLVESGEGEFITDPAELKKYRDMARYTMKLLKNARLNIRISVGDLNDLRRLAKEEGLPYQTYVSSILHKFVKGRYVEVPAKKTE